MPYRFRSARHRYTRGRYSFSSTPLLRRFPPSSPSSSSLSDPSTFSTPFTFLQRPFPIISLCISSSRSAYRNIRSRCNRADSSFNRRVRCTYVFTEYKKCSGERKEGLLWQLHVLPTRLCCPTRQPRCFSFSGSFVSRIFSNRGQSHQHHLYSQSGMSGDRFVSLRIVVLRLV